ncbi:chemotaxis protein CheA [Erythrobacter sp. SCSIO 43205]|uniref:chemotaxis protein CheA n=1 Tax=Erythrobacter sp. SCSIO 43205 TaxID=2779361 RepID=UPI001CA926EB|nr:chemotaxis protein CheA [Erythrobacter sp. SCSIO 43205]UAB77861.1 chemotaxis protein CheA [Erythrobacter sp. SCSIO 43205]
MSEAQDPGAAFRVEAQDLFEEVEQALLDLTDQLDSRALIDKVFRGMHTLKGSGAMFGFDALAGFTHHLETAFDRVRKGQVKATGELVSVVLLAMDHMRLLVDSDGSGLEEQDGEILAKLEAAIGSSDAATVASDGGDTAPDDTSELRAGGWRITFSLPPEAMVNGTNPLLLLDELRELGDAKVVANCDHVPALDDLDPVQCHIGWTVELRGEVSEADVEDVFIFVMDDMEIAIEPLDRPETGNVDQNNEAQEVAAKVARDPANDRNAVKAARPTVETVRVPAERLDVLMDRVGELVIAKSRLAQLAETGITGPSEELALRAVSEEVERLASELRDSMMILRMVPVGTLFGRFRRLVHDLATETGKDIQLHTSGESTEIDKTVSERLADPIVHLIRNSCDHGIGTADQRAAAGKPSHGSVYLSAEQAGGEVIITIRDDGDGMDREKLRAKAEANGIISPGDVLSDTETLELIFEPGFSTAETVTNLSGRGVGMDVVKRTIDALGGTIDVVSEVGSGTTFTLHIPLTLAIIEGLLVQVGTSKFVIPLSAVEECIELGADEDLRTRGRSMVQLRDNLVPFLRLRELFNTGTEPDRFQKIVVISTGGQRVGLVVDQIIGNHQTVIKSMSAMHRDISSFSGATILGDGSVALILDVVQLVALGQHEEEEERLRAAG